MYWNVFRDNLSAVLEEIEKVIYILLTDKYTEFDHLCPPIYKCQIFASLPSYIKHNGRGYLDRYLNQVVSNLLTMTIAGEVRCRMRRRVDDTEESNRAHHSGNYTQSGASWFSLIYHDTKVKNQNCSIYLTKYLVDEILFLSNFEIALGICIRINSRSRIRLGSQLMARNISLPSAKTLSKFYAMTLIELFHIL